MQWPAYNGTSDVNIFMELPLSTGSGLMAAKCNFWDTQVAYMTQGN